MSGSAKTIVLTLLLLVPSVDVLADAADDIRQAEEKESEGDFDAATRLYDRAIDSGELSAEELAKTYYSRGLAYDRIPRNDEAPSDFELAVVFDPTPTSRPGVRFAFKSPARKVRWTKP